MMKMTELCSVSCFEQTGWGGPEKFGGKGKVEREKTVDRDTHTVCPPGHDGGNERGRHDELGYGSKGIGCSGRGVCVIGFWVRLNNGHHDREKRKKKKKKLLKIDAIAFIECLARMFCWSWYRFVMTSC